MMNTYLVSCATAILLFTGNAAAGHCDFELSEAELAIGNANATVESNALEAAESLVEYALEICDAEAEQFLIEGLDSPLNDPENISMGQAMLIDARDLASGQ